MKNQQRQLSRLRQEPGIENNKQALKAIFIADKLLLEIKKLNNKIKRISRCK